MFIVFLIMCTFLTMHCSDTNTVKRIAQDCKKETYHTIKTSTLDKALEQEIANLAKTNPDKYQKLVKYDQQIRSKKTSKNN